MRMNEKTKDQEVIKCLVEKETIPKNQVDLKLLRSTFERSTSTGSRSDKRRGHSSSCETSTNIGPGDGDDVVDQSQPSMADVLDKFRRLERSRRPGRETGRSGRSSSAEGCDRRRFSDGPQEPGLNRRSFEFEDSEENEPATPQIRNLVALFSHFEGKKRSRGWGKKRETGQQRLSVTSKGIVLQKDRERRGQGSEGEGEVEMPEEGTVQTLLLQWKALETPLKKKRRSWMEIQASRQADQKKDRNSWTPGASQKTLVFGQKSQGVSQKTTFNFQNAGVTSKKPSVASQNASASPQTTITALPKVTALVPPKTQWLPYQTQVVTQQQKVFAQKMPVAPQKTQVETHKNQVESQKPYDHYGGGKIKATSTDKSWNLNGSTKKVQEQGTTGDFHETPGNEKDQDDHVSFDGIAKNLTEKFRDLERRNASSDELDGSLKRKQFRWDVKPPPLLGRPQDHSGSAAPIIVTFDTGTVTPPTSPETGHLSDLRQPDVVENSIGWKSELEEFPLPSQTKNLRAKFEALPVHHHD